MNTTARIKTSAQAKTNVREIRRLRARLSNGEAGRNAGATEAALDRRLEADRAFYLAAARG